MWTTTSVPTEQLLMEMADGERPPQELTTTRLDATTDLRWELHKMNPTMIRHRSEITFHL
jgi:hypothetical protein